MTAAHTPRTTLVSPADRLRHVLVVGKTGAGKSTYLAALLCEDLHAERGVALLDPHGDLAARIVQDVPRRRKNDLFVFDASVPDTCRGLNPLRETTPEHRSLVVANIVATIRKIWPDFFGPRTEHVLRNTLLALLEIRGATLDDAVSMLVDDRFRQSVLRRVHDAQVLRFWTSEFTGYGKAFAAEVTAPVLNKLGALLSSHAVRALVTKTRPRLDVRKMMDEGRVLIASLPKGKIGEDAALLLGGLLLGALNHAALARADQPSEARRPFSIIVDEVASFATGPFATFVTESRKYGVGLVLATQSLAAMEPQLRAVLLGNVGTLVAFGVGADDAEILSREFLGVFGPHALQSLDIGEHVVRRGALRPYLEQPVA